VPATGSSSRASTCSSWARTADHADLTTGGAGGIVAPVTKRRALLLAVIGATGVLLAAGAVGAQVSAPAVVKTAFNKTIGKTILVDGRGRTLYLWTADYGGHSACVNDSTYHCSKFWPPLRTTGAPVAGNGVNAKLLGTTTRSDGSPQVTYNHHPLYTLAGSRAQHFPGDRKPGDVNGQGGYDLWWVVSPSGRPIKTRPKP
jgi:predicted lipoprotein with Yx(FWY)xxD motif